MSSRSWLPDTPLTNPRSLLISVLLHATILMVASAIVLKAVAPRSSTSPQVMTAEFGPIDNRVLSGSGGGGPGELGGVGDVYSPPIIAEASIKVLPPDAERNPLNLSDLGSGSEIDRPGHETSGMPRDGPRNVGVLPGGGQGGGGGSGGGSGGRTGRGVGVSTEFFGVRDRASLFVYIVDRSGSMSQNHAFDLAMRELLDSLEQLTPEARFGVVFYNHEVVSFTTSRAGDVLVAAEPAQLERIRVRLAGMRATGGTDHLRALRAGFATGAEVIYFLTDARQLTPEDAVALALEAGSIRVHAVLFGVGPDVATRDPLQSLAEATGGEYRYVDVLDSLRSDHPDR